MAKSKSTTTTTTTMSADVSRAQLFLWAMLLIQLATKSVIASELKWPPAKFPHRREFAADGSLLGKDTETVEPLGRLVKLETLFDPVDVESLNTKFTIHTRSGASQLMAFIPNGFVHSGQSEERFHFNLTRLANSNFDGSKRTVILISGFMSNDEVPWMDRIKDLWLQLEDCNVIIVTWRDGNRYVYSRAAATTPRVARQVAIFIHYLATMLGDSLDNPEFTSRIQFIGHSLGGHIAGFVGQDLAGQMGRILALDPAGPSFDKFERQHRLDSSDARLVEVIHTNGGKMKYASFLKSASKTALDKMMTTFLGREGGMKRSLSETFNGEGGDSVWFGIDAPLGHIDYYANNGKTQPGCTDSVHICDHGRSHHILEGLLQHELELREAAARLGPEGPTFEQWRREGKRLLAVNAIDYAGFVSGEALNQRCPAVLHERQRLEGLAEQQIGHCSVPIDQLTPVDELIRELSEQHDISFAPGANPSGRRYYLKTLAQKPFVGDHYFLRIKLDRSSAWDESCALQAEVSFADDKSTTMESDRELRLFSNGKFFGLSLPFVNPNGGVARLALDQMLRDYSMESKNRDRRTLDDETTRLIEKILPTNVALKIIENETQSSLFKWAKGSSTGPKCQLVVESFQVHPLVGFKRSLFGLYTNQRPSGNSIRMESHLAYQARKQSEKIWPETLTPAHKNIERRLRSLVIR